jgi:hypothetical protein
MAAEVAENALESRLEGMAWCYCRSLVWVEECELDNPGWSSILAVGEHICCCSPPDRGLKKASGVGCGLDTLASTKA